MIDFTDVLKPLMAIALLTCASPGHSTGGNVTGAMGVASGVSNQTGLREKVVLTANAGVLVGKPKHDVIRLITVNAPDHNESHILLRDLTSVDGRRSLLLTMPRSITASRNDVTVFVKRNSKSPALVYLRDGVWYSQQPQWRQPPRRVDSELGGNDLHAFQVTGLSSFWLVDSDEVSESLQLSRMPGESVGDWSLSGFFRALAPVILSAILLACGWVVSYLIHRTQRSKEK